MKSQKSFYRLILLFLANLLILLGIVLALRNLFFSAQSSWWLILVLIFIFAPILYAISFKVKIPSDYDIHQSFAYVYSEQLRAVTLIYPTSWEYKKVDRGQHMFTMKECSHQAAIMVELTYLNETECNTLDCYLPWAEEFCRNRKSKLLYNKISTRWGMSVHEFADESSRTFGHKVTVPFHGTEYGFQLRLNDVRLAPAADRLFEKFLGYIRFTPPELSEHKVFENLFVNLPPEFQISFNTNPDIIIWKSRERENCIVEITRIKSLHDPLSPLLFNRVVDRFPRPEQAKEDISSSKMTTLAENGLGGYIYFQSNNTCAFFAAIGDLPTGGRYLFCLDDKDPRQKPFFGIFHYQQIAYEILVTMSEFSPITTYKPQDTHSFKMGLKSDASISATSSYKLNLDGQELHELPPYVRNLIELKELTLRNNYIQELPEWIGNLTNLEILHLSQNQLTSLHDSITQLQNLRVLGISTNMIEELPSNIGEMRSLEEIHAGGNLLNSLPSSLGKLQSLVKLNASNNCLTSIPGELANCRRLKFLYLHENAKLNLGENDLGPTWMEVKMGTSPKLPKLIIESWIKRKV